MKPTDICSGWWTATEERFVNCYDTKEEALAHVKFQKKANAFNCKLVCNAC